LSKESIFDIPVAREYTKVRQNFIAEFLGAIRGQIGIASAVDVGCGVGYFSKFLSDMELQVLALDGREENTQEGKHRFPEIKFATANIEDPAIAEVGIFDLVLCVGLLYHLENPFRAIRNLHALTSKVLLIETMCLPGTRPTMELLDEGATENQALNYVAFYPSESCLIKMLYQVGFPHVYRFKHLPAEAQFTTTIWRQKSRTFLVASKKSLTLENLALTQEPKQLVPGNLDPWSTRLSRARAYCTTLLSRWSSLVGS
jgi:SAM-dependent methyltransferase